MSTKAEACPSCGAKRPRSSGCLPLLLIGGAALGCLLVLGLMVRVKETPTGQALTSPAREQLPADTSPEPEPTPPPKAAPPPPAPGQHWMYSHVSDPMGGGVSHQAKVLSTNQVEFSFPYGGPQRALLTLRSHPRFGKDVFLVIERGQLQCFDECEVLVRFDDEPAVKYGATGPEDNSSDLLFIQNYDRFVNKLSKAKRLRLSVSVFQQGSPVFEFDVSGFDPQQYKGETSKPAARAN